MNDSDGNRTRVTAVKGRCLNRLTTEPYFKQFTRDESYNSIYFYSLQAFFEKNLEKIVSNFYCNLSWICAILYEYAAMVELAYGICLESRRAARLRGFKSLSLRCRGRGKMNFTPSPLLSHGRWNLPWVSQKPQPQSGILPYAAVRSIIFRFS